MVQADSEYQFTAASEKRNFSVRKSRGQAALYPGGHEETVREDVCGELLEDFYDGKLQNLIAALAGGNKISKEEKEELLDYIDML